MILAVRCGPAGVRNRPAPAFSPLKDPMDNERAKVIVPGWVRGEIDKMLNKMDGREATVMVSLVALLGEEGFDVGHTEQTQVMDPKVYGPVMIEGMKMLGGRALACILDVTRAQLEAPGHEYHDLEPDDKMTAARNAFNNDIREFLESVARWAGTFTQSEHESDVLTAAASQMLGVFLTIARSKLTFNSPEKEDDDATPGRD